MSCRAAISSMSLGRAWVHELHVKLDQARRYGLKGIEIFYEDLEYIAKELQTGTTESDLLEAAQVIRELCDERGLEIICLQPFMHYEGLRDRVRHQERVQEMELWIDLAKIMGTDLILIPSSFLDEQTITGDMETITSDLRELAELGLNHTPPIRFAYEALCWGTYVNTWEKAWEIVTLVNKPNFGLCIDTFNFAGRIYADPAAPSGKCSNAEVEMRHSIQRLKRTVDVRRVFLVQLVDAERLQSPLIEGHEYYEPSQPARMSWSRNCRLFYGEQQLGAYLPILEIFRAVLDLGYQGWVSAELFNKLMSSSDASVPEVLARRAAVAWQRLWRDIEMECQPVETRL